MDCPRQHKSQIKVTTGIIVPLYSVLFLFWVIEIYFTRECYSVIKMTFLKIKKKAENAVPPKEKLMLKLYNYFSYTKKCLKNKKLIFTQTQLSVLIYYNKAPTLENQ